MAVTVQIKATRDKSLLQRHPWVFSGAVAAVSGAPSAGETVKVVSSSGQFLAWGAYSPESQIRVRAWRWDEGGSVDADFFRQQLARALALRQASGLLAQTDALRIVHGESDNLPGLVVDRYGDYLVMQCLSCGPEAWRETLADLLVEVTGVKNVYERSDADVRRLEGLPERCGVLRGAAPPDSLTIQENGLRFWVDVRQGHKTGYYLDQRANRVCVRQLAAGCAVLDCFSYTGGFTANALVGSAAQVVAVDSSKEALELGRKNVLLNKLPEERVQWLEGDVFHVLRTFRDARRSFDLIILDPPKFAPTAVQAERAARGYKDINLLAFKLLRPGGCLVTFSCSGGVSEDLFQKIVAGAALDAGVAARITARLCQAEDHPVGLNFPEGWYLKGLVIKI